MTDETHTEDLTVLRTEDGAWYALPAAMLERARITDQARLDEVRGYLIAAGISVSADDAPVAIVSVESLAAYRLDDATAAELAASVELGGVLRERLARRQSRWSTGAARLRGLRSWRGDAHLLRQSRQATARTTHPACGAPVHGRESGRRRPRGGVGGRAGEQAAPHAVRGLR